MSCVARLKNAAITGNKNVNPFPADQLIHTLSCSSNIKFVVLYADVSTPDISLPFVSHDYNNGKKVKGVFQSNDLAFINNIKTLKGAMETGSSKYLLGVAWTEREGARLFQLYPEVGSYDSTEGTNNQKKSLFMGVNYDANLESNVHTYMFIPSSQKWVF